MRRIGDESDPRGGLRKQIEAIGWSERLSPIMLGRGHLSEEYVSSLFLILTSRIRIERSQETYRKDRKCLVSCHEALCRISDTDKLSREMWGRET